MALANLDGGWFVPIGPNWNNIQGVPGTGSTTIDAANESLTFIGHCYTSDGGSHTIDTSGSSSIGWRTSGVTFSNAGTTVKVGVGSVITTAGPPARANNAADVITFDVNASHTGGGGSITANSWITSVPSTGTKTIAHGDLIAISVQMTTRGGSDSITATRSTSSATGQRPALTAFTGGAYGAVAGMPNAIITFSDGEIGFLQGSWIFSTLNTRTWNSGSASAEYGQLYRLPFPTKIYGLYGWADPDADFDVVLYSDPLGTPVAEKTVPIDSNVVQAATGSYWSVSFASPYTTAAGQNIAAVYKPGGSNISTYYRTIANAAHRVSDPWGTNGFGVARASGAFASENSNLDHYYIGLIVGAFEMPAQPTYVLGIS